MTSLQDIKQFFESYLANSLDDVASSTIKEAMQYSLLAGGKRLRPMLLFASLADYKQDIEQALPVAAAIEMVHTYSLIHDDLPAMDNDVLRRGKPTCHIQFDEGTAILAGDALLTQAFAMVMKTSYSLDIKCQMILELTNASGANGMILGQHYDLVAEKQTNHTADDIEQIDRLKTGKLIALPLRLAAIIAKKEEELNYVTTLGTTLGIAFQIQDDVLNITSDAKVLGKSVHSDDKNGKATYVSLLGLESAQQMVRRLFEEVYALEANRTVSGHMLKELIDIFFMRVH